VEAWTADRRRLLRIGAAAGAWLLAGGHAPYGQWGVYRERFLLILTTRADPPSFDLGSRLAEVLARDLPESRARVSRAPHKARVASLIATRQLDLAVMRPADAEALWRGAPPFPDYGPVALRSIVDLGDFLLVCRQDFAARHAWLIARTLDAAGERLDAPVAPAASPVPLHAGAEAYFAGRPLPEASDPEAHEHGHEHSGG